MQRLLSFVNIKATLLLIIICISLAACSIKPAGVGPLPPSPIHANSQSTTSPPQENSNQTKKYVLAGETKTYTHTYFGLRLRDGRLESGMIEEDIILHRIRRIRDGALGGWIEEERNLSHEGSAWIADEAQVLQKSAGFRQRASFR